MLPLVFTLLFITFAYAANFEDRPRNFSIELLYYTQLEAEGHVVIAPFGVWTLLTGISLGASGNTYKEITKTALLPKNNKQLAVGYRDLTNIVLKPKTPEVSLTSNNFLFLDNTFEVLDNFKSRIVSDFDAHVQVLDFSDPQKASDAANKQITTLGANVANVLRSDDFINSRMILTNVISFKGLWKFPFNKTDTVEEDFYNERLEQIGKVNMMYQSRIVPFSNIRELESYVIELPYGSDGKYAMLLILPYANVKVSDMYKSFEFYNFKNMYDRFNQDEMEFGPSEVEIKLPRFKISTNLVLNRPLNAMGINEMFDPQSADFSLISNNKLFVSSVVHKCDIEVTESGTVASAASSADFSDRITPPKFYANRPFLYFLMEKKSMTVVFSGVYSIPSLF